MQIIMMKNRKIIFLLAGLLSAGLSSCTKTADDFDPQGGQLPTNYVLINEGAFSPNSLTIATGSSITFANNTDSQHSIVSDDSTTILTGTIQPHTSLYFSKDTVGTIRYHCGAHPLVKGVIYIRP
jgi:plastocyanin